MTEVNSSVPGGSDALSAADLIDDRVLDNEDQDEFRLADVVEEVAELCLLAPTPATIALYGSWGSGKSSLAKLLEKRLRKTEIAFARFDAFKYAEAPSALQRHFLSQLAKAFRVRDKRFSSGLYSAEKTTKFRVPRRQLAGIALSLVAAIVAITALALGACVVVAVLAKGGFTAEFTKALHAAVPAIVLSAPLLGAVFVFIGQHLSVVTTVGAPSSDEQFEALFRDLVAAVLRRGLTLRRKARVVVFIDELDRCSSSQVVSALETLRTFLEVKRCIFIVAADQQAIEHALSEAARQSTPFNAANPYYSAGSAYLDKIFQYQLPLPPILPRRLSRYALDLIAGHAGVWAEVPNRPELVSVLIPAHISSPRRVKALLNAFALTYRLALKRSSAGVIDRDIRSRAAEVAKLVSLRTEFPLFAADLRLDYRLPEVVLRLHEGAERSDIRTEIPGITSENLERAVAYAEERLPVAEVIARDFARSAPVPDGRLEEIAPALSEDGDASVTAGADGAEAEGVDAVNEVMSVEVSHARQLIRYLQRTRDIQGPGRDIIYLESSGAAFGLAPEVAEALERDAVDGRAREVGSLIASFSQDDQNKALRLLARLAFEAVGIEARNVMHSIYGALSVRAGNLAPVADDLLSAVTTYGGDYRPEPAELPGALELSLASGGASARRFRRAILRRDEFVSDAALALRVLSKADQIVATDEDALGRLFAAVLDADRGVDADEALSGIGDEAAERVVEASSIGRNSVSGVVTFIDAVHQRGRTHLALVATRKLVQVDDVAALDAAAQFVPLFAPITEPAITRSLLSRGSGRPLAEWSIWLGSLDSKAVEQVETLAQELGAYVTTLWAARFPTAPEEPVSAEEFAQATDEIARLRPIDGEIRIEAADDFLAAGVAVTLATQVASRTEQHQALIAFAKARLISPANAASSVIADLVRTLRASVAATPVEALAPFVFEQLAAVLPDAEPASINTFIDAADDSTWITAEQSSIVHVRTAAALRRRGEETDEPAHETIKELLEAGTSSADEAVSEFLTEFRPAPGVVLELVSPRLKAPPRLRGSLETAVGEVAAQWMPVQKADILDGLLLLEPSQPTYTYFIKLAALSEADPDRIGAAIEREFDRVTTNNDRERVMELWRLLDPSSERVRVRLIDHIYIPLVSSGLGAVKIALDYFPVVRDVPVKAAQGRVKKALKAAVAGTKHAKRANQILGAAGWISAKRKWVPW